MPHILVAGKIHEAGIGLLTAATGITFNYIEEISVASIVSRIANADAIVLRTQPFTLETIGIAERLQVVSRHGVGFDAVDVDALTARSIPLAVVGDVNSQSVAEQTLMLMLALAKRTLKHDTATRTGQWDYRNRFDAFELSGKRLLLLGFGRIGKKVAALSRAFGMEVMAHDPYIGQEGIHAAGVTPVHDLPAAFALADIVSLHIPRIGKEVPVGVRELAHMKPTAMLINTARGGLVDETALAAALAQGRLAGAGLDVFEAEPPAPDHPLFSSDQVVFTPHMAGLSQESAKRMSVSSVQNVLDFFAGRLDPDLVVNKSKLSPLAANL